MLPIVLNIASQKYVIIGKGNAFERRVDLVRNSKVSAENLFINPKTIPKKSIVFIAGISVEEAQKHIISAHQIGALVNIEDVPSLCDFHMPALVRRGDLLITISTGGRSPALSRLLKHQLEKEYGAEWEGRLDHMADKRSEWRKQGMTPAQISSAAQNLVKEQGWID